MIFSEESVKIRSLRILDTIAESYVRGHWFGCSLRPGTTLLVNSPDEELDSYLFTFGEAHKALTVVLLSKNAREKEPCPARK